MLGFAFRESFVAAIWLLETSETILCLASSLAVLEFCGETLPRLLTFRGLVDAFCQLYIPAKCLFELVFVSGCHLVCSGFYAWLISMEHQWYHKIVVRTILPLKLTIMATLDLRHREMLANLD